MSNNLRMTNQKKIKTISKISLITIVPIIAFIIGAHSAKAVTSNCVVTKVGNPAGNPALPPECQTTTSKNFIYYCQNDYKYCDIDGSGCGVTTTAMIFSNFGIKMTPPQAADIFKARGYRQCGTGSNMGSAINGYYKEQGFAHVLLLSNKPIGDHVAGVPRPGLDLVRAKNYLNNGYLIIGSTEGHIFVIDDVKTNGDPKPIHMQDPAGPGCRARNDNPPGYWSSNTFPWLNYSWYYAYAVKKVK